MISTKFMCRILFGYIAVFFVRQKIWMCLVEGKDTVKMALIVRTDLSLGKGKAASQCAHAAVMCYRKALVSAPKHVRKWDNEGQTKVVLKVNNKGEEGLLELAAKARAQGLVSVIVHDAGRTQVESGTATVLGIGPGPIAVVDKVVGHLKLY